MNNELYNEEMAATDPVKLKKRISDLEVSNHALAQCCIGLKERNEELQQKIASLEEKLEAQNIGGSVEVDMLNELIAEARNEAEYFRNVVGVLQRNKAINYPNVSEHKFSWE